ncbi:MAG TPA: hypothetical protein V6C84_30760 [Coleofasciculaceae cyanobacterium]|jgi:hypothetical protein
MPDPSPSEGNTANEAQANVPSPEGTQPEAEVSELSAEELDEVSGAGLIYLTSGGSTTTISPTPPPPPSSPPPPTTPPGT